MLQAVHYTSCCWCYKMCASVTSVRCASELQETRLYYSTQLSCLPQDSSAKARRPLQGHLLGGTVLYCCLVESSMIDNSNGMMSNNTMHLPTKMYMKPFSQHQTQPSTSEPCWDMNRLKENGWKKAMLCIFKYQILPERYPVQSCCVRQHKSNSTYVLCSTQAV